ncbi:flagellar hook-basal body complex protein FliE [uncultured Pseudodesulfovibrio sp.]|uniref:flagellar hook-basal body complex protein FliE n=1 Tax=uncultured Pseudodesulfovibrio sp. TaxID=2035858 RepID=UPI0029C8DCB0|nr:flagellar hook-basal body complex protein FliE [uncultured Pseudodesulfovibrio sp.]
MVVKSVAINAYQNAMDVRRKSVNNTVTKSLAKPQEPVQDFSETLKESVHKVNDMQAEKKMMIEEFASGKKQNVHELMITMQKAGLAMSMTSAVRNKLMSSYQEIMRMPF